MKRFWLGISALLLCTAMGFAQSAVRPATYNSSHAPRVERVSRHRHPKQKRYKNHKRYRHHNDHARHGM